MQGLLGHKFHKSQNSLSLRLNGFTKIGLCTLVSIVTLMLGDPGSLGILLFGSFFLAVTQLRIKVLAVVYIIIIIMGGISIGFAYTLSILIAKNNPAMGDYSIFTMLLPFMRILIVLQTVIVTALSTSPQEILLNLKSVKLPRCLYLPVLVMLRFIPSFINDLKQINESLKNRGLRISPFTIVTHPILTMRCSIFPLIFRALRSSDELAIASELKGVGYSQKITSIKKHIFRIEDAVMIIVAILFFSCSFRVFWYAPQIQGTRATSAYNLTGKDKITQLMNWVKYGGIDVIYDEQQLYMNTFEKKEKKRHTK